MISRIQTNLQGITQWAEGLEEQDLLSADLLYTVDHRCASLSCVRMRIRGPMLGSCQAICVPWLVQDDAFHGHAERLAQVKAPDTVQRY